MVRRKFHSPPQPSRSGRRGKHHVAEQGDEAERWLLKIHDYIASDSPVNAFNVVKSIYERAQILERFPLVGHAYRSSSGRDLRILLWGHYRIVYLVRPADEVHVVRVQRNQPRLPEFGLADVENARRQVDILTLEVQNTAPVGAPRKVTIAVRSGARHAARSARCGSLAREAMLTPTTPKEAA